MAPPGYCLGMAQERDLMLTGAATYLADLNEPLIEGAAHAVFVRSHIAHGTFNVETEAARSAPGVLAVLTAADNPVHPTVAYAAIHPTRYCQPLLAEHKVRYVGEPVAVVVADTLAQAIDAAELVIVDYDPLRAVVDPRQAATDTTLLFEPANEARRHPSASPDTGPATNIVRTEAHDDISTHRDPARFEQADITVTVEIDNPRQLAVPIECRGAVAAWTPDGDLHVWISSQTPHAFRSRIAPMYDLALSQIHVIAGPFVGGGFGGKGAPGPEEQIVAHLARVVGRPVRWTESRSENLTSAPAGRSEQLTVTLAGTGEGDLQAIRVDMYKDAGAYPSSGAGLPNSWTWPMVHATYDIAHVEFTQKTVVTNRPPVSALRGAGRGPVVAAVEQAVDRFAAVAGIDPVQLRRRNLIEPEAMPFTSPTGFVMDEANYPAALERAVELVGYDSVRADQAERRAAGHHRRQLGIGVAMYNHRTCGGGGESALVRINTNGSATVVTGTTSQGQDHETTWRTIASAELGISPGQIEVIEGVTDEISTGVGAIGSRSVQTAGLAIQEASADVVDQAKRIAAAMLEAAEADIVLDREHGAFHVIGTPSRQLAWSDLAVELAARDEKLACDHIYENNGLDVFPSGCHVAVVEVDTETGEWSVERFIGVDDAGVRVNPAAVEAQLHGGIALGIAQVIGEAATYDEDGAPLAATMMDYLVLSIDQVPQYELEAQTVATSFNVGGWKAVGESGPMGAVPALWSAVLDAVGHLGVTKLELPITPQRLWRAMAAAGTGSAMPE